MNKLRHFLYSRKNVFLLFIPLTISLAFFIFLQKNKIQPPKTTRNRPQETYHFTTLTPQKINPQIETYGTLASASTWDAVSQVEGTLIYLNPQLKPGVPIKKGTLLWTLDSSLQQLEVQRRQYEVQRIASEIEQLNHQLNTEQKLLKLEKQSLQLTQKSTERHRRLRIEGAVTEARLEQEENSLLKQRSQVQSLENNLSTLPLKIKTLIASQKGAEALLKYAQVQLSYYKVHSPLQGVISDIKLSPGQLITARQRLFEIQDANTLEVEAQLSARQFEHLFQGNVDTSTLKAEIQHPDQAHSYPAQVIGMREKVNDQTQQLAIVLRIPRQTNSLLKQGSFVNILLSSTQSYNTFLLPPEAVHGNEVYRLNSKNQIEVQTVELGFNHGGLVIVQAGANAGDRILTSNHPLIVEGQHIKTDQIKP